MQDTLASINTFKKNLFMWEVFITIIVFLAAYYILKSFKKKESTAIKENEKYNNKL